MAIMRLIDSERLDPKRVFRCVKCDPPAKRRGVLRRYLFRFESDEPELSGDYCLPCASGFTRKRQWTMRQELDASG
jgi:hypothetical protein